MPPLREPERAFEEHVATRYRLYSGLLLGLQISSGDSIAEQRPERLWQIE